MIGREHESSLPAMFSSHYCVCSFVGLFFCFSTESNNNGHGNIVVDQRRITHCVEFAVRSLMVSE